MPSFIHNNRQQIILDLLLKNDDLPSDMKLSNEEWLQGLNDKWSIIEKKKFLKRHLYECFQQADNPYAQCLLLLTNNSSSQVGNAEFCNLILDRFSKWLNKSDISNAEYCTPTLQFQTFKQTYHNCKLFTKVCPIFRLEEISLKLLPEVQTLLEECKYPQAARCIASLNLHSHFNINELVLPLVFLCQFTLLTEYITHDPSLQVTVLKLLDQLIVPNFSIETLKQQVNFTQKTKLTMHSLLRFMFRLLNDFHIEPIKDICPNYYQYRSSRALNHLNNLKYIQKKIDGQIWEEMINSLILDKNAFHLTKRDSLPEGKTLVGEDDLHSAEREDNSLVDSSEKFFQLKLPLESIQNVDCPESFLDCINNISKNYHVVGIDTEWRPNFGVHLVRPSIIQLAVQDKVYLVDMLTLMKTLEDRHWLHFRQEVLSNSNLLKLGYGVNADFHILTMNQPKLKNILSAKTMFFHLDAWHRKQQKYMENDQTSQYQSNEDQTTCQYHSSKDQISCEAKVRGLSLLVKQYLGKPLDKTESMSDWENRPLRKGQIKYAALDAYCLLEILDYLQQESEVQTEPNIAAHPDADISKKMSRFHLPQWIPKRSFSISTHFNTGHLKLRSEYPARNYHSLNWSPYSRIFWPKQIISNISRCCRFRC